jgi:TRAP transporter 4TM/12TM fusion protein
MGVAAFLIAEFLQVPYYQVALSAAIPAILYYLSLYLQADLEAARIGLKAIDSTQIPRLGHVLKDGWFFSLPIAVLFATMFWLNYEPETAALTATAVVLVAGLIFGFRGTRPRLSHLFAALRDTGFSAVELFMIGAAAGTVIASLNLSGLGFGFTFALVHIAGNNLFVLLIITAIACIILGMGMPTTGVYILLATLMAPVLVQMKVSPMAAHLFVFYYGCLSMITPPVALAAFAAANIARADPMATGYTAMRFGWTVFIIPFLFVASDTLLLRGTTGAIVVDFVLAVAGIWFGAAGVIGYSFCPVRAVARVAYCTAGLSLLIPLNAFPGARLVNVFGGCLALVLVVWEGLRRRRAIPDQNALEEGT